MDKIIAVTVIINICKNLNPCKADSIVIRIIEKYYLKQKNPPDKLFDYSLNMKTSFSITKR
jgi:hypothetical protein